MTSGRDQVWTIGLCQSGACVGLVTRRGFTRPPSETTVLWDRGASAAEIAAKLRELADAIERGDAA